MFRFAVACLALSLAACSSPAPKTEAKKKEVPPPPPVKVKFETSKGNFVVEVHPDWAPLGAERFLELVKSRFFDNARFYRVIAHWVVQFGLPADPAVNKKWKSFKDDSPTHTNALGTIAFATTGDSESRNTNVFISIRSNQTLDDKGFVPFGKVTEGLEVLEKVYSGYGDRPDQQKIEKQGNAYLNAEFPNLDYIKKATIQ